MVSVSRKSFSYGHVIMTKNRFYHIFNFFLAIKVFETVILVYLLCPPWTVP